MRIMERYTNNLEQQITDRTRMVTEETKKADDLIYQLLPRSPFVGAVLEALTAEAFQIRGTPTDARPVSAAACT